MFIYLLLAFSTLASEDLACISAGLLVAQHQAGFLAGAGACALGIFAGDLLLVLAGRSGRFVRLRAKAGFLSGNTTWKLAAARFTPGLRLPIYVAAGLARVPFRSVIPSLLLGAAIWTPLLVGAADWFGSSLVTKGLRTFEGALIGGVAVYLVIRYRVFSFESRRRALAFLHRIFRWEFWPAWAAYLPLLPYLVWLALRHRSATAFVAANPGMTNGGLAGESKSSTLRHLGAEPDLLARWVLLPGGCDPRSKCELLKAFMERAGLSFPIVLKPDIGERGSRVAVIRSNQQAADYLAASSAAGVIAQEYVGGPEFGVLYRRYPWERTGRAVSITAKLLPELTGDGRRTFSELLLSDSRALCLYKTYLRASKHPPSYVPARGERIQLTEVGSHCRGAIFLDASSLRTPELERAIERISRSHPGFYLGRFDVRAGSVDAFQRGEFKVLELNGAGSEPTHIYDPSISVLSKYLILARHWKDLFEIGAANDTEPIPVADLWRGYRESRAGGNEPRAADPVWGLPE